MRIFQAKQSFVFTLGRNNKVLLKGQLVKVPNENQVLQMALSREPFIQEVMDQKYLKIAPTIEQIKPVPSSPHMMSRDDLITEIMATGVRYNPYDLDEQLMYQVHMLRTVARKNYITVLNKEQNPVFASDYKGEEKPLLDPKTINIIAQDKARQTTIPVATNDQYIKNNEKEKSNTIMSIQKDNDIPIDDNLHLRPTMVPSSFEIYDNMAMTMAQYTEKCIEKNIQDKIDAAMEIAERKLAVTNEPTADVPIVIAPEKLIEDTKIFDKVFEEDVRQKKLFDITKATYQYFRYLIEPKSGLFCIGDISGEELVNMRKIPWLTINICILENLLRVHGVTKEKILEMKKTPIALKLDFVKVLKQIYMAAEDDVIAFEINMLKRRYDEIEAMEPDGRSSTTQGMKKALGTLKRLGLECDNLEYKTLDQTERAKLKHMVRKVFHAAKLGFQIPKTMEELDALLIAWGHDKIVNPPVYVKKTTKSDGINTNTEELSQEDTENGESKQ